MREIQASQITDVIERLCIEANTVLPEDMKQAIQTCRACEDGEIARGVLDNIIENYRLPENECVPMCFRIREWHVYFWKSVRMFMFRQI